MSVSGDRFTQRTNAPHRLLPFLPVYPFRSFHCRPTNHGRFHALCFFQFQPAGLLYKRPSLLESVHSFLHIMKLVSLLLLCIPLRALSASLFPGSPSSSQSLSPASSPSPTSPQQDMDTVLQRRLGFITTSATMVSHIASWHVPTLCLSSYISNTLVP